MKNVKYILLILCMLPLFIHAQKKAECKKLCKRKFEVPVTITHDFECKKDKQLVLVLDENFDGTELNRNIWEPNPSFNLVYPANVCNTKDNIVVSNGTAKLYVRYQPQKCGYYNYDDKGNFFMDSVPTNYTCGALWSNLRYPVGRFEINCKVPKDPKGQYWPAFWLYGVCGVEIDVFEFLDERRKPKGKSRASYNPILSWHQNMDCGNKCWCGYSDRHREQKDYGDAFHTFTVEWDEHGITWWVDGKEYRYQPFFGDEKGRPVNLCATKVNSGNYTTLYTKINKPMKVIASNGIHSYFIENNIPIEESVFEIDYIKAWTWVNPNDTLKICNYDFNNEDNPTLLASGTVVISGKGCKDHLKGRSQVQVYTTGDLIVAPEFKKDKDARLEHRTIPLQ